MVKQNLRGSGDLKVAYIGQKHLASDPRWHKYSIPNETYKNALRFAGCYKNNLKILSLLLFFLL